MNKITLLMSLGLVFLLASSMTTNAQFGSGTLSDELTETKYGWELTTLDFDEDTDFEEGDTIQYEFNEEPAGMTYAEYIEIGIIIEVNGDEFDLDSDPSEASDLETLAVLWILFWVVFDPADELTEANGYEVSGGEATDEFGYTYDTSSGVLLSYEVEQEGNKMVWEYREGGISGLPVSPLFALFGLLAIPILRRKK